MSRSEVAGRVELFQVDAFAARCFLGNPAAVVLLPSWWPDAMLQAIAAENNLAETAFLVPETGFDYRIRWFTPRLEVDLCGHATLAAAHVLWRHRGHAAEQLRLVSRSGPLTVRREGELLELDFPAVAMEQVEVTTAVTAALGVRPEECHVGTDMMCVFDGAATVEQLRPDVAAIAALPRMRGLIVTAPGVHHDFVSRFFAPAVGVDEDHVTGSAHCALTPYWAERLGKQELQARQVSARGGELRCRLDGERVRLAGRAVTYLEGWITVPVAGA